MEPPICAICGCDQRDEPEREFGLVKFADYEPIDRPGHPSGLLWFCQNHIEAAERLERCVSGEALRRLRRHFARPVWSRRLREKLGFSPG